MSTRFLVVIVLCTPARAVCEVYSYECDVLPVEAGWTLVQAWCDPHEWVETGHLLQRVEFCPGSDPPDGQQLDYSLPLAGFSGTEAFFVEWRVETDGDRSELEFTAPAALVVGNHSVMYHFTIADDQVRVIRDVSLPILYAEIEAGLPHTYRLELYDYDLYVWYIDGAPIDSGLPETHYPALAPDSVLNTRAKAQFVESTSVWDYIRFGVIPDDGTGDYDSDGAVTLDDFYFVHECLTNERPGINGGPGNAAGPGCRFADFDSDTDVDLLDIAEFQAAFTGGD